ncbi:Putative gluconolactonase protein [Rhizobium freirei PRF 81]|uniref:Putative gluconolactonase protein n=1 Tax=Rhizobium freirei PRF 81 TaxID=363754 RepID=N6UY15_9HYPH|nr:Putative gluconolactonase protein [Rhizobium freirei PRF 81]
MARLAVVLFLLSRDEKKLHVADTGRIHSGDPQHIRVFNVDENWRLSGGVLHMISPGCGDGMRLDSDGNLWLSAADGAHCIAPDGHLVGKILVPEAASNLCFRDHQRLRDFAQPERCALMWETAGEGRQKR